MKCYRLIAADPEAPERDKTTHYATGGDLRRAARELDKDFRYDAKAQEVEVSTAKPQLIALLNNDPTNVTLVREWTVTQRGGLQLVENPAAKKAAKKGAEK